MLYVYVQKIDVTDTVQTFFGTNRPLSLGSLAALVGTSTASWAFRSLEADDVGGAVGRGVCDSRSREGERTVWKHVRRSMRSTMEK